MFPQDSDFVLLKLSVYHPMIEADDNARTCTVYGSGMVRVHEPKYTKNAGDYSMTLSMSELDALLSKLAKNGLFEIDEGSLQTGKKAALQKRMEKARKSPGAETVTMVFDAEVSEIRVRLDAFYPSDTSLSIQEDIDRKITWQGAQSDAELYPEIKGISQLAEAERTMKSLMEHQNLENDSHE